MVGLPVVWYDTEWWGTAVGSVGRDHFAQSLTCLVKKASSPMDNRGNV